MARGMRGALRVATSEHQPLAVGAAIACKSGTLRVRAALPWARLSQRVRGQEACEHLVAHMRLVRGDLVPGTLDARKSVPRARLTAIGVRGQRENI